MRYYKWMGILTALTLIVGCSMPIGAEKKELPKEWAVDLRESPGAKFMIPELSPKPSKVTDWKTGYAKKNIPIYSEPNSEMAAIGELAATEPVTILETKNNEAGQMEWVKIDKTIPGSSASWVKTEKLVNSLDGLMVNRYEGVEYGPIEKTKEYPNNPRRQVKGVYVTTNSAAGKRLETLIQLAEQTEINAFVIDVKDDYGSMLFKTKAASLYCPDANDRATVKDIKALVKRLKEKNIYLIARIVSFKTPNYAARYPERAITDVNTGAIYQSRDGLLWASAFDRQLWRYNIEVAKEAAEAGFNEIQFDYVRFPDIKKSIEPTLDYKNVYNEEKTLAIHRFLRFARAELEPYQVYIAADTFGWTANSVGDENIGQHWESISNTIDYNCPMMYPSHYGTGNFGFKVPDAHPYETISYGIQAAKARDGHLVTPGSLRPWIQDFTAGWIKGHISYGPNEVRAQIQALEDNGVHEFLLWNATNRYTAPGLKPE